MADCSHCGRCCLSGIPCLFGQILFDIADINPQVCPAVEHNTNGYWCGLIRNPVKWLSPMVGDVKWKCEAMSDIASIYIGIGDGCGMNPSQREVMTKMRLYASFSSLKGVRE